jgi:hypothetical protein
MYIFDLLAVLFSGVFFISTFAFIMHCRALGDRSEFNRTWKEGY